MSAPLVVEKRIVTDDSGEPGRLFSAPVPADYLQLVNQVLEENFADALARIRTAEPKAKFVTTGRIFADEIVLSASLVLGDRLIALSGHSSMDYVAGKAGGGDANSVLAVCVDALGDLFEDILAPHRLKSFGGDDVTVQQLLDGIPFRWTPIERGGKKVWIRADQSNPELERMAEDWLEANDPDTAKRPLGLLETDPQLAWLEGPEKGTLH